MTDRIPPTGQASQDDIVVDLAEYSLAEILSGQDTALTQAVARAVQLRDVDDYSIAGFGNRI